MGVILSGKHVKPTLSTKLRQLNLWASINVMNCNYISMLSCLFTVATPYHVILCNFRLLFYFIYIHVNSLYLNKPDEDWYWPVEISQLNSISHCLISPGKSLLDCNVFNKSVRWIFGFRTTFTGTIKLNLFLKWLLGSNFSQFLGMLLTTEKRSWSITDRRIPNNDPRSL